MELQNRLFLNCYIVLNLKDQLNFQIKIKFPMRESQ